MRSIALRHDSECRKCGTMLPAGTTATYERRVGVFCPACAPADPEEIRALRQEAADRKAERYEGWAAKRRAKANATLDYNRERYTSDIAFNTQPEHIPLRARIIAQNDRAHESLAVARGMKEKAARLCHVRVAGDAERRRQAIRKANDATIRVGSRVRDFCFGPGVVTRVNRLTYTIRFDSGGTYPRDKSYIKEEKK